MAKPDIFNIIPKQKKVIPKWVNFIVIVSATLFLTTLGFFAFYYYQALSFESELDLKQSEYLALDNPGNKEVETQVSLISKKLERFSQAFSSRKISYNFFDFVRSFCHPKVSFSNLSLNVETGSVFLVGQGDTYKTISEQMIILKDISSLEVSDISLNKEGGVFFKISFTLDPSFFKNKNQ